MTEAANIINHVAFVVDESGSMASHKTTMPKVLDSQISAFAELSKQLDQETRITVYVFNSRGTVRCLIFDKDVLRMPSMADKYNPRGLTSLVDSTLQAIFDLKKTAQMYGDHSFLLYVFTDGVNNDNYHHHSELNREINSLQENWTLGVFVPDKSGIMDAQRYGFPPDNIRLWDATTSAGVSAAGDVVRKTTETYMRNRAAGIRGTKSLFKLNTVSVSDIEQKLVPVDSWAYDIIPVLHDSRIDEFVYDNTGKTYVKGMAYYQLTKKETVQPNKQIAILHNGHIYAGAQARKMLGLPPYSVDVTPGDHFGYEIFIQSTSVNRKLIKGTNALIMS